MATPSVLSPYFTGGGVSTAPSLADLGSDQVAVSARLISAKRDVVDVTEGGACGPPVSFCHRSRDTSSKRSFAMFRAVVGALGGDFGRFGGVGLHRVEDRRFMKTISLCK